MAEEFQAAEVSWWNSPRTNFNGSPFMSNYYAGGCWQNDFMSIKTRSTDESCGGYTATISPDSAFQITDSGSGSSPSANTTWHQSLLVNGRNEESYNQTLPEIILNNLPVSGQEISSNFAMNQQETSNFMTNSGDCTENLGTTTYGYPSNLLQTLFESASPPTAAAPQQQALYDFGANLNNFNSVPSMPNGFCSIVKPKQQVLGGLHLANKTPYWNASVLDLNDNQGGYITSTQPRFGSSTYEEKGSYPNMKSQNEEIRDLGSSVKKSSGEPTFKRPRLETPSPLPTFKVRKEKLGDRVTALQQLVSPFGKTDTASVLHEAIEYIKLLHDQVNVLSTPYMKNGATMQRLQIHDKVKDNTEGAKQDLRSRGLCLVPVASTFPVTTETAPDYWTSSFGSTTFK